MPRPRKSSEQTIEDLFNDIGVIRQGALLRILEAVHRQARRNALQKPGSYPPATEPEYPKLSDEVIDTGD